MSTASGGPPGRPDLPPDTGDPPTTVAGAAPDVTGANGPRRHRRDGTDDADLPGESLSSLGDIVGNIAADLSTLIRQEAALAKAEVRQSASQAGKGVGMLSGAGIAAWFVLFFLSVALWWLIGSWVGLGWSALIVAVLWAIVAAVLAAVGRTELKRITGLPQTVDTAKQIPDAMKGNQA